MKATHSHLASFIINFDRINKFYLAFLFLTLNKYFLALTVLKNIKCFVKYFVKPTSEMWPYIVFSAKHVEDYKILLIQRKTTPENNLKHFFSTILTGIKTGNIKYNFKLILHEYCNSDARNKTLVKILENSSDVHIRTASRFIEIRHRNSTEWIKVPIFLEEVLTLVTRGLHKA